MNPCEELKNFVVKLEFLKSLTQFDSRKNRSDQELALIEKHFRSQSFKSLDNQNPLSLQVAGKSSLRYLRRNRVFTPEEVKAKQKHLNSLTDDAYVYIALIQ